MDINVYQDKAQLTAIYPGQGECKPNPADASGNWKTGTGLLYCCLKLSGEVGEFNEKVGKCIRDNFGAISPEKRQELIKELGDVLWYVANLATELDVALSVVAQTNLDKLASRKERGVLGGSGDNR